MAGIQDCPPPISGNLKMTCSTHKSGISEFQICKHDHSEWMRGEKVRMGREVFQGEGKNKSKAQLENKMENDMCSILLALFGSSLGGRVGH